ncbi:MAG TPA: alpha/beta hydrolase [Terriglobia bacterium]|nr:alpha/beta hydrolase [Terriglobia bacterium]
MTGRSDQRGMPPSVIPNRSPRASRRLRRVLAAVLALLVCLGGVFYWRPLWVVDEATNALLCLAGFRSEKVQLGPYRIHYLAGGPPHVGRLRSRGSATERSGPQGGEGRPLVLVHGLGGKAQNWALMMPSLRRHGYRIYAIDLLGFGQSDRPDVDYSIALQAEVLLQFYESQHLTRADLAGWSMGGWVALKFALAHPDRVRRVVVYDSAGIYFTPRFDPALFHPTTVEETQQFLALLTPQASRIPRFVARDLIREARPTAWVVDRSMKSMQTGADLLDGKLQTLQVPVLVVWGKQDVLVPLFCGEEMRREISQSSLAIFDGCGHLAPAECSGRVLRETLRFLEAEPPLPPFTREFRQ